MKVTTDSPSVRRLTIEAELDELAEIYEATREGRRTKKQHRVLSEFGDMLKASDDDLAKLIQIRDNADGDAG